MIDSSIVRVHQHGACIIRNRKQAMGRSRGGLDNPGVRFYPTITAINAAYSDGLRLVARTLAALKRL